MLIKLIGSKDVNIKRYCVEGILAMVKTNWRVIEKLVPNLVTMAFAELAPNSAFVEQIHLPDGTTQNKDNGAPLRMAAYNLIFLLYEVGAVGNDVILKLVEQIAATGISETIDDVLLLALNILSQCAKKCPYNVVPKVDAFLAAIVKKFDFQIKNVATS